MRQIISFSTLTSILVRLDLPDISKCLLSGSHPSHSVKRFIQYLNMKYRISWLYYILLYESSMKLWVVGRICMAALVSLDI